MRYLILALFSIAGCSTTSATEKYNIQENVELKRVNQTLKKEIEALHKDLDFEKKRCKKIERVEPQENKLL